MSDGLPPAVLELVDKIQANLKVAQGQLRELERALAVLPQAEEGEKFYCPKEHCGLPFKSRRRLEEHLANVHAEGLEEAAPPPTLLDQSGAQVALGPESTLDAILPPPDAVKADG